MLRFAPYLLLTCLFSLALSGCGAARFPAGELSTSPALAFEPWFSASDGVKLAMARWEPAGRTRANILLLHGFNEYSGAFDSVGRTLAKHGFTVWAVDQRGFGRSPYRGLWSSAERMAADARELAILIKGREPGLPLILLGHSMGGAVALLAAGGDGALRADAVVLVAPAVWTRDSQPLFQRWTLDVARTLAPSWSPSGEGLVQATDNVSLLRQVWRSPWMLRTTRMDTLAGLVDLMDKGFAASSGIRVPVLLLYGDRDQLVPKAPVDRLWEQLPKNGKTRQIRYPNGWHMLMRDLDGDRVLDDISTWIMQPR
ncbi:MAG TPA: lysophospholipase [Thiolinea sp.]|nr:lysophospholipase [Thiolinea sp.]